MRFGRLPCQAIARLRRFILDLAVRGKLVPQEAGDEPASELLKRIAAEKARLVKVGEIRTPKPIPALSGSPLAIPQNWRWSQIAEIGELSPRNECARCDRSILRFDADDRRRVWRGARA